MKKFLSIFLISMFVFVGCVPKNGIQERIENVPVEINKTSKVEDTKVNPEVSTDEKSNVKVEESKAEEAKSDEPKAEEKKAEEPKVEESKIEVVVPQTKVVMISNFAYVPRSIALNVGDSILWKHDDVAAHDSVSVDGLFKSPVLERGGSFSFKFEKAGTYEYYCSIHPSMRGTIVVQ